MTTGQKANVVRPPCTALLALICGASFVTGGSPAMATCPKCDADMETAELHGVMNWTSIPRDAGVRGWAWSSSAWLALQKVRLPWALCSAVASRKSQRYLGTTLRGLLEVRFRSDILRSRPQPRTFSHVPGADLPMNKVQFGLRSLDASTQPGARNRSATLIR